MCLQNDLYLRLIEAIDLKVFFLQVNISYL